MENKDNLICIYDNTKDDFNQVFLSLYETFIIRELEGDSFIT